MNIKKLIAGFLLSLSVFTLSPRLPADALEMKVTKTHYVSTSRGLTLNREEFLLLARLIHAEARGESLLGQVAVGAVVFNRLNDAHYPKTITRVIYDTNQFSPVSDGSINLPPDEKSLLAAELALNGLDPTNGCLFFYNPEKAEGGWFDHLPAVIKIGSHVFC